MVGITHNFIIVVNNSNKFLLDLSTPIVIILLSDSGICIASCLQSCIRCRDGGGCLHPVDNTD